MAYAFAFELSYRALSYRAVIRFFLLSFYNLGILSRDLPRLSGFLDMRVFCSEFKRNIYRMTLLCVLEWHYSCLNTIGIRRICQCP